MPSRNNRSLKASGVAGLKNVLATLLFKMRSLYKELDGSTKTKLSPSCTPKCSHNALPFSGRPIETITSLSPAARSSSLRLLYCSICSWQNGHPRLRRKTTSDVPVSPINWFMLVSAPLRVNKELWPMAALGSSAWAASEGAPETMAPPHPQSSSVVTMAESCWTSCRCLQLLLVAACAGGVGNCCGTTKADPQRSGASSSINAVAPRTGRIVVYLLTSWVIYMWYGILEQSSCCCSLTQHAPRASGDGGKKNDQPSSR